ncbi:MAG: hypothetical protein JSS32_07400 [Verrucomicrobia bacterium]|nr:hypothetical protein [Verrucomicrobiota bacterium]
MSVNAFDTAGITASYLYDKTPAKDCCLSRKVSSLLQIIKLSEAEEIFAPDLIDRARHENQTDVTYSSTAKAIAITAIEAEQGNVPAVLKMLKLPICQQFDGSDNWYNQPRVLAFEKAVEAAATHNKPEVLEKLLVHPLLTKLKNDKPIPLSQRERRHLNSGPARRNLEKLRTAINSQEAVKHIFRTAASNAARMNDLACLQAVFKADPECQYIDIFSLLKIDGINNDCKGMLLDNIDTSDRI